MKGADIFKFMCGLKLDFESFDWLENRGLSEFEMLISVILTQNTSWNNVLKALANLRSAKITNLERLNTLEVPEIATLIKPSGFYNTKAKRLKNFLNAIEESFENFADFKKNVSREWLISVKGLGFESVDSILNYICGREILVVDSYTKRLAAALGYEFESYDEMREFFESGIEIAQDEICALLRANENSLKLKSKNLSENLGKNYALFELYQIFHAQIIAFGKAYFKGANLNEEGKKILTKFMEEF